MALGRLFGCRGCIFLIGIAINANNTFAYVTNSANSSVSICTITSSTGALTGCTSTGSNFTFPAGITLNPANTAAYVANSSDDSVTICDINQTTGALTNCTVDPNLFIQPIGLAIS